MEGLPGITNQSLHRPWINLFSNLFGNRLTSLAIKLHLFLNFLPAGKSSIDYKPLTIFHTLCIPTNNTFADLSRYSLSSSIRRSFPRKAERSDCGWSVLKPSVPTTPTSEKTILSHYLLPALSSLHTSATFKHNWQHIMKLLEDPNFDKIILFYVYTQCFDHFYKRFSLSLPLQALKSHVVIPNLQSLFLPKYWPLTRVSLQATGHWMKEEIVFLRRCLPSAPTRISQSMEDSPRPPCWHIEMLVVLVALVIAAFSQTF